MIKPLRLVHQPCVTFLPCYLPRASISRTGAGHGAPSTKYEGSTKYHRSFHLPFGDANGCQGRSLPRSKFFPALSTHITLSLRFLLQSMDCTHERRSLIFPSRLTLPGLRSRRMPQVGQSARLPLADATERDQSFGRDAGIITSKSKPVVVDLAELLFPSCSLFDFFQFQLQCVLCRDGRTPPCTCTAAAPAA